MSLDRKILYPLLIFGVSIFLLVPLSRLKFDWGIWEMATCMPAGCFCERLGPPTTIRQPVNAWTSLAFYLVGLLVAFQVGANSPAGSQRAHDLLVTPLIGYTFALSLAGVGLGSAFYHASFTLVGQFFDVAGMYLVTTFMLVYAWTRLYRLPSRVSVVLFIGANLIADLFLILIPETRRIVFAVIMLLALAFEFWYLQRRKPVIETRWLKRSLALFALAYLVWILDNQRLLCSPESLLQGHAFWHIAGAAAAWWLFLYYRSETMEYG